MDSEFNLSNTIGIGLNIGEQMLLPVSNAEEEEEEQQQLQHHSSHFASTLTIDQPTTTVDTIVRCIENPIGNFYQEASDLEDLNAKLAETTKILEYTQVEKSTEMLEPLQGGRNTLEEVQLVFEAPAQECKEKVAINEDEDVGDKEHVEDLGVKDDVEIEEEIEREEDIEGETIEEDEVEADEVELDEEVEEEGDEAEAEDEEIIPDEVIVPENAEEKDKDELESKSKEDAGDGNDDLQNKESNESEQPSSSIRANRRKEEQVDENQCRVCCVKDNLVSIFKKVEDQTVAEMLMTICPSVSIVIKDFLPQFICNTCYDNVGIAIQLKNQCETTEKELRKKLSRHKNKIRRPAGYVVIDAPLDSDPPTDEEPANDEEFKVSDIASISPSEDSDTSEFSDSKRKRTRGRKRRKSAVVTPTDGRKSKNRNKSDNQSSDEDEDDGDPIRNKRKRSTNSSPDNFACDECDQSFSRKQSLVLHKRQHTYGREEPITCEVCGKKFKIKGAYRTHLEKHKEERRTNRCAQCSRRFTSSSDLKRHIAEEHRERDILPSCSKCNRTFSSAGRLQRHKQTGCPAAEANKSKKTETNSFAVGTDLFKAVAPLQTTYWSDSFSD